MTSSSTNEIGARRLDRLLEHCDSRPRAILFLVGALIALIALVDWKVRPNVSLGAFYVLPVVLSAACLSRLEILAVAGVCSVLREVFGPFHGQPGAVVRLMLVFVAFTGAGLLVSEMARNRRLLAGHLRLEREAEMQTRVLAETSPLAFLTLDSAGKVLVANTSAHRLLGFEQGALQGEGIGPYLPVLASAAWGEEGRRPLRTAAECHAKRRNGEVFLAHVWFSTYQTSSGNRVAAAIWDASETLRDREAAGLDALMAASRGVVRAVSHEVRNVAAAAASAYASLKVPAEIAGSKEYQSLGSLVAGLERIAESGLRPVFRQASTTDLLTVLDEFRIVVEPWFAESGIRTSWRFPKEEVLVRADHVGLLQVFLNLARNSLRALEGAPGGCFAVEVMVGRTAVLAKFRDNGPGVKEPQKLFQPFQAGAAETGLGLYVSRAMVRSFGGELRHEPQQTGTCFTAELRLAEV